MDTRSSSSGDELPVSNSSERTPSVRVEDLGHLIRSKRWSEGLTLEQAAREIGVSAATLSRWERGGIRGRTLQEGVAPESGRGPREPDVRTLTALARWLRVSFDSMLEVDPLADDKNARNLLGTNDDSRSTPEVVEAHLRADRNLEPDTAAALARMFRVAYEQFTKFSTPGSEAEQGAEG